VRFEKIWLDRQLTGFELDDLELIFTNELTPFASSIPFDLAFPWIV